jgi:hypothetical protein
MRKRRLRAATKHTRAKRVGIAALGGYDAQLRKQRGGCAICGAPPKTRRLNIDHEHLTLAVRGLLCARCNRGLGWFRDRADLLEGAAVYLTWGWDAACLMREARTAKALKETPHG